MVYKMALAQWILHYIFLQSTDMNWYTKRLTLLAIYKSSELAMMNDKSDDFKETWEFLDRCGHKLIFVHLNCQFVCTKRNSFSMEGTVVSYRNENFS